VCLLSYNGMYLFAYCNSNVMMETYFSDETYKLPNSNQHKLLKLDRCIAGHDVSLYCEQFETYWKRSFFFQTSHPNGPKMNFKWPLRRIEMGSAVWMSVVGFMACEWCEGSRKRSYVLWRFWLIIRLLSFLILIVCILLCIILEEWFWDGY
jgi:hypothetical protein